MGAFASVLLWFGRINAGLLRLGCAIGAAAVALMVVAILIQVWFRYVLNNALPWPDEAARFCMLWMTGLMAPTAFRRGGFVAIELLGYVLPRIAGHILSLALLFISLLVLVIGIQLGWKEVTGFGGRFATASLYVPLSMSFDEWMRVPRSWMMSSLLTGCVLLAVVNIELILRSIMSLMGGDDRLPPIDDTVLRAD